MKSDFDLLHNKIIYDLLDLNPSIGTNLGLKKYNDKFEITISKNHILKEEKLVSEYLTKFEKVRVNNYNEKISCLAIISVLKNWKKLLDIEINFRNNPEKKLKEIPYSLIPINQLNNPINYLIETISENFYEIKNDNEFKKLILHVKEFTKWFNVAIENMKIGISNKIVLPKVIANIVLDQLNSNFNDKSYLNLIKKSKKIDIKNLNEFKKVYENEFLKELEIFIKFFKNEYLKKCRNSISINDVLNNDSYQAIIESYDIKLKPNEIHKIGLKEVNRINNLIKKIMKKLKFNGTVNQFHEKMKNDSENKYNNKSELKKDILKYKKKFDEEVVKKQFDIFPSSDYVLKKFNEDISENLPGGSYLPGSIFGKKRSGIFYYNSILKPFKYDLPSLVLHEGNPGHHFQATISQDYKKKNFIPIFYPNNIITYDEGWGLYCEGLYNYEDLILEYGKLNSELFRAIRLVVDTGIHEKRWNREKVVKYMKNNLGHSDEDIESEVNRYISDPGQALCYKIGQMQILKLKKKFLKKNNNVKDFHRKFLQNGEIPLSLLKI